MNSKKKILAGIVAGLLLIIALAFTGCDGDACEHQWSEATCVAPKTCGLCGETEGEALGHTPRADDGDCTTAITCSACDAVLTEAKTAHEGGEATCSHLAHCSVCNKEYGELLPHAWNADAATEENDKHCTVCGYVAEEQIGHTHQYEDEWTYDDEGHYHAATCEHTYAKKDYATHSYQSNVTDPACTEQGYTTYTCVCGKTYKDDYLSAKGHDYADTLTYDNGGHWYEATCEHDVKTAYGAHTFESAVTEPTCTEQGYTIYTCACGYSYVGDYTSETGHSVANWTEASSTPYNVASCQHAVSYTGTCSACNQPQQKTEYVEKHAWTYVVKVGCEATCQEDGIKLSYCKNEACQYHDTAKGEVPYSDPSAHTWVEDSEQLIDGMISYHCEEPGCTATKNTVSSSGTSANVPSDKVGSLDEVELDNAVIGFDQGIKDKLSGSGSDVAISAGTLAGDEREQAISDANLSPEQESLLGSKEIYNFTVTTNENVSILGGTATIRIPYELNGEDPDHIIVWYIENGKLTGVPATYADGYVTFTTTHFSYYVATTIAPEQLCEALHQHDLTNVHTVLPTCTESGYSVCLRCGKQIEGSETAPLGHEWHTTVLAESDCTTNGVTEYACSVCEFHYETVVSAKGHYYVLKDQKNATCSQSGYATHGCVHCESEYTTTLPQLNHQYVTNVVEPTCEASGYSEKTCLTCGDTVYTNYVDATGHRYDTAWHTSPTGHYHICTVCGKSGESTAHTPGAEATEQSAQICTVCEYVIVPQLSHTHSLTKVEATEASCLENGNIAYYTCACGKWFLDAKGEQLITDHTTVIVLAVGHTHKSMAYVEPTCTTVGYTAGIQCSVCNVVLRGHVELSALGHDYVTTETAPTCSADGVISKKCAACGHELEDEIIPKLEHKHAVSSIKAPTCTEEGVTTYACVYCGDSYTDAQKDALGHSYSAAWSTDEKGHWHACTRCGDVTDAADHTPGAEATETTAQICTVCEFVITPIQNHTHTVAQAIPEKAPTCEHTGNIAYYICSCGEWFFDKACETVISDHKDIVVAALGHALTFVEEQTPTCTEDGYTAGYYCERCEDFINGHESLPAAGHRYVDGVCTVCGDGGKEDTDEKTVLYTYQSKELTLTLYSDQTSLFVELIYTADGMVIREEGESSWFMLDGRVYAKTLNGREYVFTVTEDGKLVPHKEETECKHENTRNETLDATCTENGYRKEICEDCEEILFEAEIEALGHSYTDGVCTACGDKEVTDEKTVRYTYQTDEITLTLYSDGTVFFVEYGFDLDADGKLDSIEGEGRWHQTADGIIYVYTDYNEYEFVATDSGELTPNVCAHENTKEIVTNATCTEDGYRRVICYCGEVIRTELIAAAFGHSYDENGVCETCGAHADGSDEDLFTLIEEAVSNAKREWSELLKKGVDQRIMMSFESQYRSIVDDMQFAESIEILEEYQRMFDDMIRQILRAAGGDVTEPETCPHENTKEIVTEATCTTDGSIKTVCGDCDEVVSKKTIPALGHAYDENGVCERCGASEGGSETDLSAMIEEAVAKATAEWEQLPAKGVSMTTIKTHENIYRIIIENMKMADSVEALEAYRYEFDDLIRSILRSEGDVTDPCTHESTEEVLTDVTCTEDGYRRVICVDCGEVVESEIIADAFGHDYDENGICGRCGSSEENTETDLTKKIEQAVENATAEWKRLPEMGVSMTTIKANETKYQFIIENMKTAETVEYLEKYQSQFRELIDMVMKEAGGDVTEPETCAHENTKESVTAATCTNGGYRRVICGDCGKVVERELVSEALGHAYNEEGVCERCGEVEEKVDEDLLKMIEETVAMATAEWEQLLEKGVSMSTIKANEAKYQSIMESMRTAKSFEMLADSQEMFRNMIDTILKDAEGDITEPEDPEEPKPRYIFKDVIDGANLLYQLYEDGSLSTQLTDPETGKVLLTGSATWRFNDEAIIEVIAQGGDMIARLTVSDDDYNLIRVNDSTEDGCAHKSMLTGTKDPTCTEAGYTETICNECKEVLRREYIPAYGHAFDENGICGRCGASDKGTDEDLIKRIEEAVENAAIEWDCLPEKGVSMTIIKANEMKYLVILEDMKNAKTLEELENYQWEFRNMVDAMMKEMGGDDVTEPEDPVEPTEKILYLFEDDVEGMWVRYEFYANGELHVQLTNYETGDIHENYATWELSEDSLVGVIYDGQVVQQFTINEDNYTLTPVDDSPEDGCAHKSTLTGTKDPTCTEAGYTETICNECKEVLRREYIPAYGHAFDENGICGRCGASDKGTDEDLIKRIEEAVESTAIEWDCLPEKGVSMTLIKANEMKYLVILEDMKNAKTLEELENYQWQFHNMVDAMMKEMGGDDVTEPEACTHEKTVETITTATCTEAGYRETFCADCGEWIGREVIAEAFGHSYSNGKCEMCGEMDAAEEPDGGIFDDTGFGDLIPM